MSRLVIVRSRVRWFSSAYLGDVPSQITEVRIGTVTGWVREWRRSSSMESFVLSSSARLGHKADMNRIGNDVLQLAAPASAWDAIAELVAQLDALNRPVERHQRWTTKTAPLEFTRPTEWVVIRHREARS
ncbi:MAG: hypothetical protein JWO36_4137 [Myxococcales bacterium]|nr:hypothetical protein [Myxococcales bacterium]